MPFDGLTLGLVSRELNAALKDGRIDKVSQPERDELILTIRAGGKNHQLLLSASAGCARAHLTKIKKTGTLEPPALCMLLRKHIIGGRIVEIRQINCDRILEVEIEHYDELGDKARKKLICEFMGKYSNIMFVGGDGRIIDSARRVNEGMSSVREVLPGLRYELPPEHGKINFDAVTAENIREKLAGQMGEVWKLLSREISGLSSQAAKEIAYRICGNENAHISECDLDAVAKIAAETLQNLPNEVSPRVYINETGETVDFSAFEYLSRAGMRQETFPTISETLDEYYRVRDSLERVKQKGAALHRVLKTNIERLERKLALQREALLGSQRMDEYRLYGELLNANLYMAKKGEKSVALVNYYDEAMPTIDVPLDEKLSPAQNAQRYFKLYQKARNAQTLAAEQIEKSEEELAYLEGQMDNMGKCEGEAELTEIRDELEKFGYVKANRNRRQMKQLPPSQPMKFTLSDGTIVLVGKNNLQNDKLTFTAQPDEVWLHAKDMPGSHVIIVGANPSDSAIAEAARLAAKYSKGGASTRVPVDYTLRKFVKKPSGAKPGFVIYTHQHTLYAEPADDTKIY